MSDHLNSVAGGCERDAKRAEMTHQCKSSSPTPSTAAFLALLLELNAFKNRCEALSFETQCITGLASKSKELQKKMALLKETKAAAKTAFIDRGKRRDTAANERVVALQAELAEAKDSNARLVNNLARSELGAKKK